MNLEEQIEKITSIDVPSRHTSFQLIFFVIGKEPTHQAKLKRCFDELNTRKKSIEAMKFEIEELKDKNELTSFENISCEIEVKKE